MIEVVKWWWCEDADGLLPSNQSRAHHIVHSDGGGGADDEAVLRTNGQTRVSTGLLHACKLKTGSKFAEERDKTKPRNLMTWPLNDA